MKIHSCYLITNGPVTYVGYTVNPKRRIRQHNRELKCGGAKKTKRMNGNAYYVAIVSGFESKVSALQFEWAWDKGKSPTIKKSNKRSKVNRIKRLYEVLHKDRWTSHAIAATSHPPLVIHWYNKNKPPNNSYSSNFCVPVEEIEH